MTLFEKTFFTTNVRRRIAALRPFGKCALALCRPFVSTHRQRASDDFSVLCISSRFRTGVLSCRLSHVCTLVAFLSLLLPGLVLAQVSEHVSSEETDFKKERRWEENIPSTRATTYPGDRGREERFWLKSDAYGLAHDKLRSEMPVGGSAAVNPATHTSMDICDRTAVVMDAILSRISATNDCSEITNTQLAAIADTLDLSSEHISSLQAGDLDGLVSLTGLDLRYNDLSTLPVGIFDELTSLTFLHLGANDLSTLPDGIFDELTSLTILELKYNDLSTLPAGIFSELTSLIVLDLSSNDLFTLADGIFDELISLKWLWLEQNDLSTLPAGIFDELTSLTALRLEENDLSTLPAGIFDELTLLTTLDMQDNDLSMLPAGIFDELTSLTRLDLGVNDLSTLSARIFDELTSLTELDLAVNDLSTLPSGIFDELTSLTELDLAVNDLSLLPGGIFDSLTSLTELNLGENDLSTLPDGIFGKLAGLSLRNLSLGANPGAPFRPVVNAGADLTVRPEAAVSISGSVTGPWGDIVRWDWIQVDGPDSDTPISRALPLTGSNTARPSFTAPTAEGELYFRLVVAPGRGGHPNESYGHTYSNPDWVTVTVSKTAIDTLETLSVGDFKLLGNYPNPFYPSTTILLDLPQVAAVTVDVFNVLGQRVHREEFAAVAAGASKPLPLDVSHLSSGAYVYQVTARMGMEIRRAGGRMTRIK